MAKAQVSDDKKQMQLPDTLKNPSNDFDEWLRNEPLKPQQQDSTLFQPVPPDLNHLSPQANIKQMKPVQVKVMTPKLRQDMILCYQGHMLEEQQKQNRLEGGAMMVGVSPLSLAAFLLHKLFPNRKSKKERQREKLKQVLDNY